MEVAKALGGPFKLVTPAPNPVREMTQLPRETQKDGDTPFRKHANLPCVLHTKFRRSRSNRLGVGRVS